MLTENVLILITTMSLLTEVQAIPCAIWGTSIHEESSDGILRNCHHWKEWVHRYQIAGKGLARLVRAKAAVSTSGSAHTERRPEPVVCNPTLSLPHTVQGMLSRVPGMLMFGPGTL